MTTWKSTLSVCATAWMAVALFAPATQAQDNASARKLVIHADQPGDMINKNI